MNPSLHQAIALNHFYLYECIRRKIARGFRQCIRRMVQGQGGPALRDYSSKIWQREGWTEDAPGLALARRAGADGRHWSRSIGLIIAFRLDDTVRVILPLSDVEYYRRAVALIARDQGSPILSPAQAHRVLHALINLTGDMQLPPPGSGIPHRGMLAACLASGLVLYCSDVTQLGDNREWPLDGPNGKVSFVSAALDAEHHLGMVSVLYLPIALSPNPAGIADLVIGLYSPYRDAFGPAQGPMILDLGRIRPLLEELQHDLKHSLSSLELMERMLGRDEPSIPIREALATWREAMKNPKGLRDHPPAWFDYALTCFDDNDPAPVVLTAEDFADSVCFALESRGFLPELQDGKVKLSITDASLRELFLTRGFIPGAGDGHLKFPTERVKGWLPLQAKLGVPGQVLAEAFENSKKGVPGSVSITIGTEAASALRWLIEIRNQVSQDYPHFLPRYWVVKQRHLFQWNAFDHTGRGPGMGLYGQRLFAKTFGFNFEVNSPVPALGTTGPLFWLAQFKFQAKL